MIVAHALGGIRDLPIPGQFFLYGGGVVLGLSFIALGVLWTDPHLERIAEGRPVPPLAQRILLSRGLRAAACTITVFVFGLVLATAFAGKRSIDGNLAPTTVWVLFWLGLVPVSLLIGNVWSWLSPLRAIADVVAWLARPLGWKTRPYPERLGWWPAALLLFAFAAMELVYPTPADPRHVGIAVSIYAAITWAGMAVVGRRAWHENGEAFNVYYGLFAQMAAFTIRGDGDERQIVMRPPLVGLIRLRPRPGTVPMVAVMLGSVGFDSITRTSVWQNLETGTLASEAARIPVKLAVLAVVVSFVACAYLAAVWFAGRFTTADIALVPRFIASLVPIAFVYAVAHYVSLLLVQGQYAVPLAYRLRWYFRCNLREVYHLCELRTTPQGHPDYRWVAQEMFRRVQEVHPRLAAYAKFVDLGPGDQLERRRSERRIDERLAQLQN